MNTIQILQYTSEQFQSEIKACVKEQLNESLKQFKPKESNEYLTRKDVADLFKVNITTVSNWQQSGKLKPLQLGSRIYFLKSDIEACLIPLKQD
ncbi:MAG TPA: helix-turn-helix domain-containing protein [Flavobacterium sp.]|jgi:DNA-binding transcriptional regulator YiaG